MKRRRFGYLLGLSAALAVCALVWWFFFSEFMAVDRCLDAGGRWADGDYCAGARIGE